MTGVERVWLNCSVCHVGTYHLPGETQEHYVYGAPSNNLRLYDLIRFFIDVGRDPGFTADVLVDTIDSDAVGGHLNVAERAIYRYIVFPRVQSAFLALGRQLAFVERQEDWRPGRVDTFNPYKAIQFNFPMGAESISDTALNGSADYPSIWMQRPREGMNLHWDGNNSSVAERNLSAALGAGVTPVTVDRASIRRVEDWMWDLPAPVFPAADRIDGEKARRGEGLFATYCAGCHGMARDGAYDYTRRRYPGLGQVVPLPEIATDPGRWGSYTPDFAGAQNTLYAGYPWRFQHFRKTDGYVGQPLDGIWARSPSLHNGSVPTLRDLLEPAADRPTVWFRGSDMLDLDRVGYHSDPGAAGAFRYDTSRPGNSNKGHEGAGYGTALSASDKDAIVEYMKRYDRLPRIPRPLKGPPHGIALNLAYCVPLLVTPAWTLSLFGIPQESTTFWPRLVGGLLVLISTFYVPMAIDFDRYRIFAWLSILPSRTFGATFLFIAVLDFGFSGGFLVPAVIDASVAIASLYCMTHVVRLEQALGDLRVER